MYTYYILYNETRIVQFHTSSIVNDNQVVFKSESQQRVRQERTIRKSREKQRTSSLDCVNEYIIYEKVISHKTIKVLLYKTDLSSLSFVFFCFCFCWNASYKRPCRKEKESEGGDGES